MEPVLILALLGLFGFIAWFMWKDIKRSGDAQEMRTLLRLEEEQQSEIRRLQALEEAEKERLQALEEAEKEDQEFLENLVLQVVSQHKSVLLRKRRQLLWVDEYGVEDQSRWLVEVNYFIDKVVCRDVELILDLLPRDRVSMTVCLGVLQMALEEDTKIFSQYSEDMSGLDFEVFCADILRDIGWAANVTKGSGDQGVDVVATKDGKVVAIQCKKYSSPVGNAAVQEAYTGKAHYNADVAVVVSNNSYTPAARQLASTTGVRLLHYTELVGLEAIFLPSQGYALDQI